MLLRGLPENLLRKLVSAAIQQDLDTSEEVRDNETLVDSGLDMARRMYMMMTMHVDLTKKGNGQMDSPYTSPAKAWPEARRSMWQNTSSQDLDLDEAIWRELSSFCSRYQCWRLPHHRKTAPVMTSQ